MSKPVTAKAEAPHEAAPTVGRFLPSSHGAPAGIAHGHTLVQDERRGVDDNAGVEHLQGAGPEGRCGQGRPGLGRGPA